MPARRRCLMMLSVSLFAAASAVVAWDEPATKPPHDFARWEADIAAFEAEDRVLRPQPNEVMFTGSSTMRMWKTAESFPDLTVLNRGFGGSEVIDSVHFAERILGPHRPRVLMVYAGSNDLSKGTTPAEVAEHFTQLVKKVHAISPETEVVYLSIKPTVRRWPIMHRIRAVNALIEANCIDLPKTHYLNVYPAMLNAAGEPETAYLAKDGLHLNPLGYQYLTALVRPTIDRLLAGEATAPVTTSQP